MIFGIAILPLEEVAILMDQIREDRDGLAVSRSDSYPSPCTGSGFFEESYRGESSGKPYIP